ncbi:MAG: prolyl oligopeptidase family serine peptidase [Oligoflexales bacterium]|nr:prolyl oligopeptidase family serine peptidase [Oligoflexales bacterium]
MKKNKLIRRFLSFSFLLLCLEIASSSCLASTEESLELFKSELDQRSLPTLIKFKRKRQARSFEYFRGKIQIDEIPDPISFHFYKSLRNKSLESKPLVLIFPGFTGLTPLDYYMGRYYAKLGYNVAISHFRDEENEEDPTRIHISMKNGLLASLGVLDTVTKFKEVDKNKIAILGYSFGGIRASFLAAIDERISPVVLIVAGANLSQTLSQSKFPAVKKLRETHMKKLQETSVEKYEEYLKGKFPYEPYEHLNSSNNANYLTVTSKLDKVVPWKVQESLVSQLSDPMHLCFRNLGHCTSVCWFVIRHLKKSKKLFRRIWESSSDEQTVLEGIDFDLESD